MKSVKLLTMLALTATSLSPLAIATPAFAQSATTGGTMTSTCAADLAGVANVSETLHDGTPVWSTVSQVTGSVDGPATEVPGSRVETPGTRFGTGSATYSNLAIAQGTTGPDKPYRNGGSVNMFGDKVATMKNWSNSEYNFTAQYATVTTFSYQCNVTQQSETYFPAVHIPGHKVQGYYVVDPSAHGNDDANQQACAARNADGDSWPHWGENTQQCLFVKTGDAVDPVDQDEYWVLNAPTDRADLGTSHTLDETNYANGNGHEANAGPWSQSGSWFVNQVVICISPKKLPGIWTKQNGYTGSNCTTAWFNVAPWGGGSQTSNGTYISVPGV